ncbi:MAG: site-2 protease family protein [Candidatus Paceibacterota bacterium]|jgi:Zn-dependent protease
MDVTLTVIGLIILLFSVILHEIAHGTAAYALGDPTAKNAGRLTLNPISHLDPVGSILLPGIFLLASMYSSGFNFFLGWAKPVPVNPFNYTDKRWGQLKVGIAGVAVNFLIAVVFSLLFRFVVNTPYATDNFLNIIWMVAMFNFVLGIFNLLPFPPLDGSHVLFSLMGDRFPQVRAFLQAFGMYILIFLLFSGLGWIQYASSILFSFISGV